MMLKRHNAIFGFGTALVILTVLLLIMGCDTSRKGNEVPPQEEVGAEGDNESAENGIVHGGTQLSPTGKTLGRSIVAIVTTSGGVQSLCTGSLIAKDLVLTAAHCVEKNPERVFIVFAENVEKASPEFQREARGYLLNPHWRHSWEKGKGDLALVHFGGKLPGGYSPIKLAPEDLKLRMGSTVKMMGYGVSDGFTKEGSGVLREMKTKLREVVSATEVMSDGWHSSVCFGDSGGPAFIKKGRAWEQWGVASFVTNRSCSEASVHTGIMDYLDWIHSASLQLRRKLEHKVVLAPRQDVI